MHADKIIEQRKAGLISDREARDGLTNLANQSLFNANYSDHPDSYRRWIAERNAALRALAACTYISDDDIALDARTAAQYRADRRIDDAKDPHDTRS